VKTTVNSPGFHSVITNASRITPSWLITKANKREDSGQGGSVEECPVRLRYGVSRLHFPARLNQLL